MANVPVKNPRTAQGVIERIYSIKTVSHTFTLTETTDDILKLISSLLLNKASVLDGISCRLLKEATSIVAPSLTHIINLSITIGIFPDEWKLAIVSLVYKEGGGDDPNNYRPISVLPVISKLIERIVLDQFYEYLIVSDLLADTQSGFKLLHSTQTALLEATNECMVLKHRQWCHKWGTFS